MGGSAPTGLAGGCVAVDSFPSNNCERHWFRLGTRRRAFRGRRAQGKQSNWTSSCSETEQWRCLRARAVQHSNKACARANNTNYTRWLSLREHRENRERNTCWCGPSPTGGRIELHNICFGAWNSASRRTPKIHKQFRIGNFHSVSFPPKSFFGSKICHQV